MTQRILMIAGPNGAGKTTMALTLIPDLPMFYEFILRSAENSAVHGRDEGAPVFSQIFG